ncbi:hypothetical protein OAF27_02385, partial [Verrucomicrobiales bacterium]|nr:hypothetical protein [Verrucomicrobiales bacterium]
MDKNDNDLEEKQQIPNPKRIFVCVHGIGKQHRGATVRSVANRLASSTTVHGDLGFPYHPQALGYFYKTDDDTGVFPLDTAIIEELGDRADVRVAEVFWADLPQRVIDEGRTIEETKEWADTVVARAYYSYQKLTKDIAAGTPVKYPEPDFSLASEVLGEVIDTVRVLERLAYVGEKAGMPKVDLRAVFEEFLGDVQIVTEFAGHRDAILDRFSETMRRIHRDHEDAEIHIIAHSEGTVISFLGLLRAMSRTNADSPSAELPGWVKQMRSYMTIGSPLDKHVLLWPALFEGLNLELAEKYYALPEAKPIHWKNYYDLSDPIGFKLDSTRRWLESAPQNQCKWYNFDEKNDDHGFARYTFPGKAHNDYWEDEEVFEHYLKTAVFPNTDEIVKAPKSRVRGRIISPILLYGLSFFLFFAAVGTLYYTMGKILPGIPNTI